MHRKWLRSSLIAGVLIAAAFGSGCATQQYRYVPSEQLAAGGIGAGAENTYPLPPGQPSGSLRVRSVGVVDIKAKNESKKFPALHIRVSITNQSDNEVWTFTTQDQFLSFPNQAGAVQPALVNSDYGNLPTIQINPRELRNVDFFYPLPQTESSEKKLSNFDFHWQILVRGAQYRGTTHFERIPIPEAPAYPYGPDGYPYYPSGWGVGVGFGFGV